MHRPTSLLAVAAAAVLALAACGSDDAPSDTTATTEPSTSTTEPSTTEPSTTEPSETTVPPGGEAVPAEIAGVHWILDGYYTVGGLQPLPVDDAGAGLTIEADGTVAIETGCNQGSATATFDGDLLQLSPIAVTKKACLDEDVMRIEQMLLGQLEEQQNWHAGEGGLSLTAATISDTGLHFYDAANPPTGDTTVPSTPTTGAEGVPADLVGVQWVLDGTYTVGGLQPLPVDDTGAGLSIDADGQVAINGGCNQGSGTATFDGDEVRIDDVIMTAKACADEEIMRIEQTLTGQLEHAQHWNVTDGYLNLFAVDVTDTGMRFHDAANPPTGDTIAPPHT